MSLLVLPLSSGDLFVRVAIVGFVGFHRLRVMGLKCWSVEQTKKVLMAHVVCNNDSDGRLLTFNLMVASFFCKMVMADSVEVEERAGSDCWSSLSGVWWFVDSWCFG